MRATDLMVDDWVFSAIVCRYVQVVEILNDSVVCSNNIHIASSENTVISSYKNISPITITPEILIKNGFRYADLPFEDFYEGYGLQIHGGNYADGHSNWYISCGTNVSMNVTYVHELQHALRLCHIDKDIKLS